jgi:pantoate--beta-alanine ligase
MKVIERIAEIKDAVIKYKNEGKSIGFVPTMGYLHEGHISLVNTSVNQNDVTIISIFINPTQFGPGEDFEKYPRDMKSDLDKASLAGVDIVFTPTVKEMYPEGYKTYVNVEGITEILCGRYRPGHFNGVTTVVNKLFNIVEAHRAYFGQKDAQQLAVIKKMVKDLNMNIEIVGCPIIRENDGLAMSSRNVYLSGEERKAAVILSKSLCEAENLIKDGTRRKDEIIEYITNRINSEKLANIEYTEIVNADSLEEIETLAGKILIALAVKFGRTRLIDNVMVEVI